MTVGVNYSQIITPFFSLGLDFSGFFTFGDSFLNNTPALLVYNPDHNKLNTSAGYFYRVSQNYPTYILAMPLIVEIANWSHEQIDFPMPIRNYLEIKPFYIQNNLNFTDSSVGLLDTEEQNFGVGVYGIATYESTMDMIRAGRYAIKGQIGFEIASSQVITRNSGNTALDLPRRPLISPDLELSASWQF